MATRIAAFEKHYAWVDPAGLAYFRSRTRQAPRDASFGLAFVLDNARTRADQDRCVGALERKCEILWSLLDAIEASHRRPRALAASRPARRRGAAGPQIAVLPERGVRVNESGREILDLCDGTRSVGGGRADAARAPSRAAAPAAPTCTSSWSRWTRLGVLVLR